MVALDEIADTLAATPAVIRTIVAPFAAEALLERPAPGEWCCNEVVGHLINCDAGAFRSRISGLVAGTGRIDSFDAHAALADRDVMGEPIESLLEEFEAVRAVSVGFVRDLDPDDLARVGQYEPHGSFAARDFVLEWPFHDHDHIRQILANLQQRYLPDMSDTMRTALTG